GGGGGAACSELLWRVGGGGGNGLVREVVAARRGRADGIRTVRMVRTTKRRCGVVIAMPEHTGMGPRDAGFGGALIGANRALRGRRPERPQGPGGIDRQGGGGRLRRL